MRVNVIGDCDSAKSLRGNLSQAGYVVSEFMPRFTIRLDEHLGPNIIFDSIDCELERKIFNRTRELTPAHISVQTVGGIQSDREIRIVIPANNGARWAVELGAFRGLEEIRYAKRGWRKFFQ